MLAEIRWGNFEILPSKLTTSLLFHMSHSINAGTYTNTHSQPHIQNHSLLQQREQNIQKHSLPQFQGGQLLVPVLSLIVSALGRVLRTFPVLSLSFVAPFPCSLALLPWGVFWAFRELQ
jgi:hypothetical protein